MIELSLHILGDSFVIKMEYSVKVAAEKCMLYV